MSALDELARDPEAQIDRLVAATQGEVERAQAFYVRSVLSAEFGLEPPARNGLAAEASEASQGLELVGFDLVHRFSRTPLIQRRAWHDLLWSAFRLRRSTLSPASSYSDLLNAAVDGVLANRQPELRLELRHFGLNEPRAADQWDELLESEISRALLLLIRKHNGFGDLQAAREIIARLRELQREREATFLEASNGSAERAANAIFRSSRLVALYNLAALVDLTAEYLLGEVEAGGQLTADGVKDDIDRFTFTAREVLSGRDPRLRLGIGRFGSACRALVDASVYSPTLPRAARALLLDLAKRDSDRPLLELWYAQRAALQQSLLDLTRSAVVVSMPTSAGKTLLAELAIAQAHADDPEATIVYLAPTRALVTQASLTLRRDLADRELRVRVASPVFELDPVEDQILTAEFDVLVTTPEKLDLLIREGHESVRRVSLVVVDEAHNLADGERGARLELLLATLRRERQGTRFLLLSPFASNASDLARWLGGDSGTPIVIDWKPNDRVVGLVEAGHKIRNEDRRPFDFLTLDSAHSDCRAGEQVSLGWSPASTGGAKKRIAQQAALRLAEAKEGGVLLLATSRAAAEEHATALAERRIDRATASRSIDVVTRFLDTEAGGTHPLSELLRHGVAFHHAGLSSEARYFVERLVEEGAVDIICATTTLAQGVHFPLSAAVIETIHRSVHSRGRWRSDRLKNWELWNIAGRVGRTLEDSLGLISFASTGADDRVQIQGYLREDASEVASSLLDLLRNLRQWDEVYFSRTLLENEPAASAFLQYIMHALAVSGDVSDRDLEALLRASLMFEQAQADEPELANEMIRIARSYVESLREKKGDTLAGFAKLADGTGFSSPSVDLLWSDWRGDGAFAHENQEWVPEAILPEGGAATDVMTHVIETLHRVPEVALGSEDEGEFSAARLARITSMWVDGVALSDIADREYSGDLLRCAHHVYGTVTNLVPWGMRAVQRVALADAPADLWRQVELVPGMIYHGVRSPEAIALRMLSVPRMAAEGLARRWRATSDADLPQATNWLDTTDAADWSAALPDSATISGEEAKALWEVLEGRRAWRDLAVERA